MPASLCCRCRQSALATCSSTPKLARPQMCGYVGRLGGVTARALKRGALAGPRRRGLGKPANRVGPERIFGYLPDITGYDYDPAKARALIRDAGAQGAAIPFLPSPAYDRQVVEAIQ